jgi:hypothetical protein
LRNTFGNTIATTDGYSHSDWNPGGVTDVRAA